MIITYRPFQFKIAIPKSTSAYNHHQQSSGSIFSAVQFRSKHRLVLKQTTIFSCSRDGKQSLYLHKHKNITQYCTPTSNLKFNILEVVWAFNFIFFNLTRLSHSNAQQGTACLSTHSLANSQIRGVVICFIQSNKYGTTDRSIYVRRHCLKKSLFCWCVGF